ncbi:Arc family DNA-binding protein [Billgrantia tianxiuensis]|nr:Arc family DNA-binding protein [Halomonas sp. MCCC 1A11057]
MDGFVQTNVRLPRGIVKWLKEEARRNRRSYSAEVAIRLERSRREQEQRERHAREGG